MRQIETATANARLRLQCDNPGTAYVDTALVKAQTYYDGDAGLCAGVIETSPTIAVEFMPSLGEVCCGRSSPVEQQFRARSAELRTWRCRATACAMVLGLLCGSAGATPFNGLPASSSPTPQGITHLVQDLVVTDQTTGAKLRLPLRIRKLHEKDYTGGKGQHYSIDNLIVSVLRFDPSVRSLGQLYRHYPKSVEGRRIDAAKSWLRADRFALEGVDGDHTEFSIDMVESGGELRGLSLVLSRRSLSPEALSRLRKIAADIRASFDPFPAAAAPVTPPPTTAAMTPLPDADPGSAPLAPAPAPVWSVPRRSDDGAFEQYTGATLTGVVLLESSPGRSFSNEECAAACKSVAQCTAYTRFGDGSCVMRSSKGEVQRAPSAGTSSGVRSAGSR